VRIPAREGDGIGQPVVHFEVVGKAGGLRNYYSELFGWEFGDPIGPTNYAVVPGEGNTNSEGAGIGGGVGMGARATRATSPSTSRFPTSERRWRRRRASAGPG
jgi:predicted enzyme related to lactoylglutathione lyase